MRIEARSGLEAGIASLIHVILNSGSLETCSRLDRRLLKTSLLIVGLIFDLLEGLLHLDGLDNRRARHFRHRRAF